MQFRGTEFYMSVCPTLAVNTFFTIQRHILLVPLHIHAV